MVSPASPKASDPYLGRVLADRFQLTAVLGEGAMGKVYRAQHATLKKPVAVKVLRPPEGGKTQRLRRFKAEARAASRLDHPNVIRVLDFGVEDTDGLLYLAMEYLEGEDLQALVDREGALELRRALEYGVEILAALAHAHGQGVLHRDMKPGNVILFRRTDDDGRVVDSLKVLDFGLAKILDEESTDESGGPITRKGSIFGTPAYMSPEQAKGETLDARSDVYAVGVMLFKMITGTVPFRGDTAWAVLQKQIREEPPPLSSFVDTKDPRVERLISRALAKDPARRFETARAMRQALIDLLETPYVASEHPEDQPTEMDLPRAEDVDAAARTLPVQSPPPRGASDTILLLRDKKKDSSAPSVVPPTLETTPSLRWAAWTGLAALLLVLALGAYVYFSLERGDVGAVAPSGVTPP